jgi:hypothetical protein
VHRLFTVKGKRPGEVVKASKNSFDLILSLDTDLRHFHELFRNLFSLE